MERLRSLTLAAVVAALAPGCIHVHTDGDGRVKSIDVKAGAGKTDAPVVDPEVKPAAATVPAAPAAAAAAAGLAKFAPKLPGLSAGPQATEMAVTWQNRPARLPDPTRSGAFGTGLVGQMFLFGPGLKFAPADGKLTVELFDETPRPGGAEPARLGSWTLEKEVLKRLVTHDERFGKCYALFLPWPTYAPAVTRVRLMARYEPEAGFALYADPTTMTLDTTVGGDRAAPIRTSQTVPVGPVVMPAGPAPGGPAAFPAPIPLHAPTPAPPGGPAAATGAPPGLPPIALTLPGR